MINRQIKLLSNESATPKKMKANFRLTKTRFLFICIVFALGLNACGARGDQAPQCEITLFSPNGKYFVFTNSELFIRQYSKKDGEIFKSVTSAYCWQAVDCEPSEVMLGEPVKSKEMKIITNIESDSVRLSSYEINERWRLAVLDIAGQAIKYIAKETAKCNLDILKQDYMGCVNFYKNS